jgi:phosphomethylpyrimidine synthase
MADYDPRIPTADIGVTTGPICGSRKIHVAVPSSPDVRVAMREIVLDPSCSEPPLRVYDTSGPYTDPRATIDINAGLPQLRRQWIEARGDVESYDAREIRPEDNGQLGPDHWRQGWRQCQPDALRTPWHHHARDGICRDAGESRPRDAERV